MTTLPNLHNECLEEIEDSTLDNFTNSFSPHIQSLVRTLHSDNWSDRNIATKKLGYVSSHRDEAVDALLRLLQTETKPQVRKNAVRSLGLLGDPRAIPVLQQIIQNPAQEEVSVRTAAHLALKKLDSKSNCSLTNDPNLNRTISSSPTTEFDFVTSKNKSSSSTFVSTLPSKDISTDSLQQTEQSRGKKRKCELVFESVSKLSKIVSSDSGHIVSSFPNIQKNMPVLSESNVPTSPASSPPSSPSQTLVHEHSNKTCLLDNKMMSRRKQQPISNNSKYFDGNKSLKTFFPKISSDNNFQNVPSSPQNTEKLPSNFTLSPSPRSPLILTPLQEAIIRSIHDFPQLSVDSLVGLLLGNRKRLPQKHNYSLFILHPLFGNFKKKKEQTIKEELGRLLEHDCVVKCEGKLSLVVEHPIVQQIITKFSTTSNCGNNNNSNNNNNNQQPQSSNVNNEIQTPIINPKQEVLDGKSIENTTETKLNDPHPTTHSLPKKVSFSKPIIPPNCDSVSLYTKTFNGIKPLKPFNNLLTSESNTNNSSLVSNQSPSNTKQSSFSSTSQSLPSPFKTRFKNPLFEASNNALAYLMNQNPNASTSFKETKQSGTNPLSKTNEKDESNAIVITQNLCSEKLNILMKALSGQSFFFTGAAGTGKSFLLKEIVQVLRQKYGNESVAVTAPTGIAACSIGGCTIHAFAGIGLGNESKQELLNNVCKKSSNIKRWKKTSALVVDEVSMLSGELFDKLNYIAQKIRNDSRPYGGIQVILCGDFFQLPPVSTDNKIKYCFEADSWSSVVGNRCYELKEIYRQQDPEFIEILNEVRKGEISQKSLDRLNQCKFNCFDNDGIEPTLLCTHKKEVQEENCKRLRELPGEIVEYKAHDKSSNQIYLISLQSSCPAPELLQLKVGAQVILVKNLNVDKELVNGSRGIVIGFVSKDEEDKEFYPLVQFANKRKKVISREKWAVSVSGKEMATREQFPLQLAWALSIHKSQGMTIDRVEMDLSNVFEYGQAYVALSRVTSLKGLKLLKEIPQDRQVIRAHPAVLNFYKTLTTLKEQ